MPLGFNKDLGLLVRVALNANHEFTSKIIESLPGIFYLIDQNGRFALWNKNFEQVIAVSDANGGLFNPRGLDLWELEKHVAKTRTVVGFPEAEAITNEQLLETPCEILVPAALERQITEKNAGRIQCRILAEAANGPTTPEADVILDQRPEIFVIPDILCNAGGVIVSYFEWVQDLQSFFWSESEVTDKLFRILEGAFSQTLNLSRKNKTTMRLAALCLGIGRVREAKKTRGLFP